METNNFLVFSVMLCVLSIFTAGCFNIDNNISAEKIKENFIKAVENVKTYKYKTYYIPHPAHSIIISLIISTLGMKGAHQ